MKRTFMLVLTALMIVSLMGCTTGGTTSASPTKAPAAATSAPAASAPAATVAPAATAPEAEGSIYPLAGNPKFDYWFILYANLTSLYTNFSQTELAKYWQEATGVELNFIHPTSSNNSKALEELNIIFASDDLPDIIHFSLNLYTGGVEKMYTDGAIIKLNDYLEQWAPNLTGYFEKHPDVAKLVKKDDGSIYNFPLIMEDVVMGLSSGPSYRTDLLKKYGLEVPDTIAEVETVFRAFRDGGDVDVPFICQAADFATPWIRAWDIYIDNSNQFFQKNGVVSYAPIEPAYKDFLTTMNRWYSEGLIDANYYTTDRTTVDTMMSSGLAGSTHMAAGQGLGVYIPLLKEIDPAYDLEGGKYPTLEEGQILNHYTAWESKDSGSTAITTACEDIENAVKFLDFNYCEEGKRLLNFGVEGKSYEMVNGVPTYTELITKNPDGLSYAQSLSNWTFANSNAPFIQALDYYWQYMALPQQSDAIKTWNASFNPDINTKNLGFVSLTLDETAEYAKLYADIKTYVDEMNILFITGKEPLDKVETFQAELKAMGVERCIAIYQAGWNRFINR